MSTTRITISGDDGQTTDVVAIDGRGPTWTYSDVDGDGAAVYTAVIPEVGAGVYLRTAERGCSIAAADVEGFIAAIRATLAAATEAAAR